VAANTTWNVQLPAASILNFLAPGSNPTTIVHGAPLVFDAAIVERDLRKRDAEPLDHPDRSGGPHFDRRSRLPPRARAGTDLVLDPECGASPSGGRSRALGLPVSAFGPSSPTRSRERNSTAEATL
jgi:hypothetical protein